MNDSRKHPAVGAFLMPICGHIINGRCAGSRPVSRFDSGCSAFSENNKPELKVVK